MHPVSSSPQETAGDQEPAAGETIRVDVELLDGLMNLVGELVLARNQILQFAQRAQHTGLLATSQRLNLVTTELQSGVMRTRMQPLHLIFHQLPRLVRDESLERGTEVRLELHGASTELDRNLLEAARRPVLEVVRHVIRHCVPEHAAGVDLVVGGSRAGGQVVVEVKLVGKRGTVTAPDLAAMDAIAAVVEVAGGSLENTSTDAGPVIRIKLPLTLAIIPALILMCGDERYAVPQGSLLEVVRLDGGAGDDAIEWIGPTPVHRLRGALLPLVMLDELIGSETGSLQQRSIVVLETEGCRFGLVTDDVGDTVEIVVKPLSSSLKQVTIFAGATILGDGSVALIIDPGGVVKQLDIRKRADHDDVRIGPSASVEHAASDELLLVMVGGSRFALPVGRISRIEEIPAGRVEQASIGLVTRHGADVVRLDSLGALLGRQHTDPNLGGDLEAVIFQTTGEPLALVVDEVADIVRARATMTRRTATPGTLGASVIDGEVVDIVDIEHIYRVLGLEAVTA